MSKMLNGFLMAMQKFAMQRHVVALRDGMILALAPTMIGSVFLILRFLPIEAYTNFMDNNQIGVWLMYPVAASMDMIGLFILIGVAYRLAEGYKLEPLGAIVTTVMSYMVVNPLQVFVNIPEQAVALATAGVPISILGTKGLFVAIIVAILSVEIYRKVIQANFIIKMPDSVPPAVAKSFMAIIPTLFAVLVALLIRVIFESTEYGTLSMFIEQTLSAPLKAGVKSFAGTVSYVMIYSFFWSMGVHGSVTDSVYAPIWSIINDENRLAFQQGVEQLPNLLTMPYLYSLVSIGGTSATMAFIVLSLAFARSNHLKQVSKLALGPGIFQINEPIIFGVPVVLNPMMMIPFIIVPGVLAANAYIWVSLGWAARPTGVIIPWTMPSFINAYFQTNGNIGAVILEIVNFFMAMAIYYPFFKIIDKEYLVKEGN